MAADQAEAALAEPSARPFDLTGRPMKGWLLGDLAGMLRTRTYAAGSTGAWPMPARRRPSSRASHHPLGSRHPRTWQG